MNTIVRDLREMGHQYRETISRYKESASKSILNWMDNDTMIPTAVWNKISNTFFSKRDLDKRLDVLSKMHATFNKEDKIVKKVTSFVNKDTGSLTETEKLKDLWNLCAAIETSPAFKGILNNESSRVNKLSWAKFGGILTPALMLGISNCVIIVPLIIGSLCLGCMNPALFIGLMSLLVVINVFLISFTVGAGLLQKAFAHYEVPSYQELINNENNEMDNLYLYITRLLNNREERLDKIETKIEILRDKRYPVELQDLQDRFPSPLPNGPKEKME